MTKTKGGVRKGEFCRLELLLNFFEKAVLLEGVDLFCFGGGFVWERVCCERVGSCLSCGMGEVFRDWLLALDKVV